MLLKVIECDSNEHKTFENKLITKNVRPKIVNREKHWGKHRKQWKHYVKHGETEKEIGGNMCGLPLAWIF